MASGVKRRWAWVVAVVVALWAVGIVAGAVGSHAGASTASSSVPPPAAAEVEGGQNVRSWHSDVDIQRNGDTVVTETIAYDFGTTSRHGIYRTIPTRFPYDTVKKGYDRVTPVRVLSVGASVPGAGNYAVQHPKGGQVQIRIGSPNRLVQGVVIYTIAYEIDGALNHFADHDELDLNLVGPFWAVPIHNLTATVRGPAPITKATCYAGDEGSTLPCDRVGAPGSQVDFLQQQLAGGDALTAVVALPPGAIVPVPTPILEHRWTLASAFSARADTLAITAAGTVLALALFSLLAFRKGRDHRFRGSAVDAAYGNAGAGEERVPLFEREDNPVEFVPPTDLRPGQVSVLVHERARPLDVTATIVDLASRGFLRISEVEKAGGASANDWTLTKVRDAQGLKDYEQTIFDGLFSGRDEVRLSELRTHFHATLRQAEEQLVDDTVTQGWFRKRPDRVRAAWIGRGVLVTIAGAGLTIGLAAKTTYALCGLPLVLLGVLLVIGSGWFPYRTAKGHAVFRHVLGFKRFIDESETQRARFAERKELFTEYLPYAVAFGNTQRWAKAFAGLDQPPPSPDWYVGTTPFTVLGFAAVMSSFSTATSGSLAAVAAPATTGGGFAGGGFSGFSGGFAGGGFGGGGGGSW